MDARANRPTKSIGRGKKNISVLFLSRGRGHGHAIPDLAIADEIEATTPIRFTFASYATGAATIAAAGRKFHNLGFAENNPFLPTLFKCRELIQRLKPDVVIAHEEFAGLPAAALCGVPAIFLSAWCPPDNNIRGEALAYANSIVIIEEPGVLPVPLCANVKPLYVGRAQRQTAYGTIDRATLREEFGIAQDAVVIVVITGGSASEKNSPPIAEAVLSAYLKLARPEKRLFWVSAKDHAWMQERLAGLQGAEAIAFVNPVERLLVVADVVITKGTHTITVDCDNLGVPSISLSPGNNPIDDTLVPRIRNNIPLNARAVDGEILLAYIERILANRAAAPSVGTAASRGPTKVAETIKSEILRLVSQKTKPSKRIRKTAP